MSDALDRANRHRELANCRQPLALEESIIGDWPLAQWRDVKVMVAVSGGPDSVALLRALHRLQLPSANSGSIEIAHFNHGWRETSDDDQTFVVQLGRHLDLLCHVGGPEERCEKTEEAARTARYRWLLERALAVGARYIAIGHSADDQVETILHRILRGTGLHGLAGIPFTRRIHEATTLVRPMLRISRTQILDYLQQIQQDYCIDASNQDTRFTRNAIRQQLLPQLRESYNPNIDAALSRLADLAQQSHQLIERLTLQLAESSIVQESESTVGLDCQVLADCDDILVRELFRHLWRKRKWPEQSMGFDEWTRLSDLARTGTSNSFCLPGKIRVCKNENILTLESVR